MEWSKWDIGNGSFVDTTAFLDKNRKFTDFPLNLPSGLGECKFLEIVYRRLCQSDYFVAVYRRGRSLTDKWHRIDKPWENPSATAIGVAHHLFLFHLWFTLFDSAIERNGSAPGIFEHLFWKRILFVWIWFELFG